MKRRQLLAIGGIGITSIAGCFGLGRTLTSGSEPSSEDTTEENQDQDQKEDQEQKPDQHQEQNQEEQSPPEPDADPRSVVELVDQELIYDEAEDPNYESDELFIRGVIRNTSEHPLRDVRFDGYVFVSDEAVGHEYLQYAQLEASGERQFELPFFVENPAQVDDHETEVTAANWA